MAPVVILAAVLLASMPDAAHAQPPLQRDTWLLTGALGLALDADADPSMTLYGAAAFPFTSNFAIEGELGHVFDTVPGDADLDASLTTVHATALYFFDTEFVLTPYVAAGIGLGKYSFDLRTPPISDSATEVGFNLGGGVTYPIGRAAYFRGDFRYFKHIDDVPSIWRFSGGVSVRIGS
jgi:opacity protein-like surface antigen